MVGSEQKRAFAAVILSGLILFTWQVYFAPKAVKPVETHQISEPNTTVSTDVVSKSDSPITAPEKKYEPSEIINLKNGEHAISIGSNLLLQDMKNPTSKFPFDGIIGKSAPFQIFLTDGVSEKELTFNLKNVDEKTIRGTNDQYGIDLSIFLKDNGRAEFSFKSQSSYRYRFMINSEKGKIDGRIDREFMSFSSDVNRVAVGDEKSLEEPVKWFGIDFNHHVFAFVYENKMLSKYSSRADGKIIIDMVNPVNSFKGDMVFSEKNYDHLIQLGDKLELSVNFGLLGIIAVPILRGLQFFYKFLPNYGIAIILLTLLIRTLTFPLQYKSFKSMKKMQIIQPELAKIKEKYKSDPQKMQKETMELFKRAGANPLGGCLPLILQMPVFFAFYKVLYEAVELVGAPFYFWIHDLSQKDPFYVLPVLMAFSMLLQQKFTPSTTTDPSQKKIMMIMPVVFGFIMKDLPSGLVLYIFVSTIFGMLQQLFVYRSMD